MENCRTNADRRGWRRSPISSLAHSIRMDAVRHANIYPTCRLDKSNRAVYEPEDVGAKRAALVKPMSRSNVGNSRMRGIFKQKVLAMSTAGVTKAKMDSVDLIKETVAVLMKNKEREADLGKVERRFLQPELARGMARMNSTKKADFEQQVQQEVERVVHAAKRRYVRRQEKLDKTGVFHPEANAHRVHTQFWAYLNNTIDITKIENEVWIKMSSEPEKVREATARSTLGRAAPTLQHSPSMGAGGGSRAATVNDSNSTRPSSKDSSRYGATHCTNDISTAEDEGLKFSSFPAADDSKSPAPPPKPFAGILGYEELGHVPTLDEFRAEWPKLNPLCGVASPNSPREGGAGVGSKCSKGKQQALEGGQAQQHVPGSVVNELSKRDEVFQHFKKYYDKAEHYGGRRGDALFPAGIRPTGLLRPDFDVVEAVGRHAAQSHELRSRSRIGEGLLAVPVAGARARLRRGQGHRRSKERSGNTDSDRCSSKELQGDSGDGFANMFRYAALASDCSHKGSGEGVAEPLRSESGLGGTAKASGDGLRKDGDLGDAFSGGPINIGEQSRGHGGATGTQIAGPRGVADSGRAKACSEGSSTSAEMQARLETSWRALFVPAKLKLDFLQKYSTLERCSDLPRMAQLLDIASKAVPLREKVVDLLHRIEDDGEPISAASVFSADERGTLYGLDCWKNFSTVTEGASKGGRMNYEHEEAAETSDDDGDGGDDGGNSFGEGTTAAEDTNQPGEGQTDMGEGGGDAGSTEESKRQVYRRKIIRDKRRREAAEAVLVWLRSIESGLADKCAEVCDAAWFDLGDTITYKGRPVANNLPETVMEAAAVRRENRKDRDNSGRWSR